MSKPVLWLLLADLKNTSVPAVLPSVAWLAEEAGARLECYLEVERGGELFATYGSTVIGGMHHQQFNYLHAIFDVRVILYGDPRLFNSSVRLFGTPVLAQATTPADLYRHLQPASPEALTSTVVIPSAPVNIAGQPFELAPYCFPEIFCRRALGFTTGDDLAEYAALPSCQLFGDGAHVIDAIQPDDTIGRITLRIARRWTAQARGVAFGDPAVILTQLPVFCREGRVALYGLQQHMPPQEVDYNAYIEETTEIVEETAELAIELGNRVLVGRQTCDGDLFAWSRHGVCLQIIDPNRPAFPVVATVPHVWADPAGSWDDFEPTDEELRNYARESTRLTTLIIHSGEVAHNEAMLNLCDLASWAGVKMGVGVHAARYATCPQLWELLAIPRERGGVRGYIEPVLHSGGMGVLAESHCPPALLAAHCRTALAEIRAIAGDAGTPRGYYAFCDTDLTTLTTVRADLFAVAAEVGLDYFISSALPGRNRLLADVDGCLVLNQSPRIVCQGSPYVRINGLEGLHTSPWTGQSWLIAALDAPVVAFAPHIWRDGAQIMRVMDALRAPGQVNVTPHTIRRYAKILDEMGVLPGPRHHAR
jgi:hypothetical protein